MVSKEGNQPVVIFVGNIGRLRCRMSLIAWNLSLYGAR